MRVLFNFHVFVNFPVFILPFISIFIPLWSENTVGVISALNILTHFVFLCGFLWVHPSWSPLDFLHLDIHFLPQTEKFYALISLNTLSALLSLSPSRSPSLPSSC